MISKEYIILTVIAFVGNTKSVLYVMAVYAVPSYSTGETLKPSLK